MSCFYKAFFNLVAVLCLVAFSQRSLAAIIPVTTNANSGAGSLAQAITDANNLAGADVIEFTLPADELTLNLTSGLPVITEALFINGYSQAGAATGTIAGRTIVININGAGMPGGSSIFVISSSDVSIAGLAIYGAPDYAIRIGTNLSNVHIWGNYIGTDETGNTPGIGNGGGILCNFGNFFPNVASNIIIGTDGDNVNDDEEGNLVCSSVGSGLNGFGIVFWLTLSSNISGNIIGLDKNGVVAGMGNAQDGVLLTVSANGNTIGTDGDGVSDAVEGNIIADNGNNGILLAATSDNNIIAGNKIGLDAVDNAAGNNLFGIALLNSSATRIGTDGNGSSDNLEANIISSNARGGIGLLTFNYFANTPTSNNIIAGNIIGTDATLALDRGNTGSGIFVKALDNLAITDNIIGSNNDGNGDASEGNIITNNDTGISVTAPLPGTAVNGNKFSRNSIYLNAALGIDLGEDGVTVNDDGDGDVGANDLFNAPVILTTQVASGNLTITGYTRPNSIVEFYVADAGPNPDPLPGGFTKSFGEGRIYLFRAQDEGDGTIDGVVDDLPGATGTYDDAVEGTGTGGTRTESRFSFSIPVSSLPVPITASTRITALAYENASGAGNTSEFGGAVSTGILPVNLTSFKGRLNNEKAELTWTTAEEHNNSHFEVERSASGQVYTKIGTVQGNGGTNNVYQYTDNGPLSSVNYYRLKQVDIDGEATYTKSLVIRKDLGAITAKAVPSPFTSFINLSYKLLKEENLRIRLIDPVGRVVKTYSTRGGTGVNTINLNGLDNLPKGTYIVELAGETVSFRQQVLKQ